MATRPSSPTSRARPGRCATSGAWRAGRGPRSNGAIRSLEVRGGAASEARERGEGGALVTHVWMVPLVAITLTQIAVVATSVYLHRTLAHRALAVHPVADLVFRIVLWLTTGQRRQEWVAVHRKHHAFTDREGDPHSPRLLGLWRGPRLFTHSYPPKKRSPDPL